MIFKKLSIIIPAYNEEKTILEVIARVLEVDLGEVEKEIIIVDDGSSDKTAELLKNHPNLKIIFHERNKGKGAAMRSGIKEATGDYIISQDADLEYDPEDIRSLIEKAREHEAAAVYGSRRLDKGKNPKAGHSYYLGGVLLSWLTNILHGTGITDEPTCYKLVKREVLEKFEIEANGFEYCPEITAKIARLGHKIHEVPISYNPRSRAEGKKIKFKDAVVAAWVLVKFRMKARKKMFRKIREQ
jgi:dolichol-phosphate mannosyltransferase